MGQDEETSTDDIFRKGGQALMAWLDNPLTKEQKADLERMAEEHHPMLKVAPHVVQPVERIIAAAIQIEGVTLSLPLPARHGQVLHAAEALHMPDHSLLAACQGFLTSTGRFVNRVQAKQIAHIAGQPQLRPENERTHELYSEDLW